MSDLPDGWDVYDPDSHERSGRPEYRRARAVAAERAERRRLAYGTALFALRRARSLTQVALAEQLGVAQAEVSRIEHQADMLLSTLVRYVHAMDGELSLLIRFPDHEKIEIGPDLSELLAGVADPPVDPQVRRYNMKEARFRGVAAA